MAKKLRGLPSIDDDGLPAQEVGAWALEKYRRVFYYDQLFSRGMKKRFDQRVYIDLFAGAGISRIRGTATVVPGSPLLALMVDDPFTKYVFVERDPELLDALRVRAGQFAPDADVTFLNLDVNADPTAIVDAIPAFSRGNTQLSFCFVDPFSVELDLEVIRTLSTGRKIDFLVLLALGMDANRNVGTYTAENHDRLDRFLGDPDWRSSWADAAERGERFICFLATRYIAAMRALGYRGTTPDQMYPVRSDTKNLGLYYLAFFSKHPRGHHFWREVLHYNEDQFGLEL